MHPFRVVLLTALLISSPAVGLAQPPLVLVADIRDAAQDQCVFAASLQGVANQRPDGPRVFLIQGPRDQHWLDYSLRMSGGAVETVTIPQLFDRLSSEVKGQVLYDPTRPYTLDLATAAAGLRQAVISSSDLGLPTLYDLRGKWESAAEAYRWALDSLLPGCTALKAAMISSEQATLRDFAIQNRLFTISPPASPDDPALQEVLFRLPPGTAAYGNVPFNLRPVLSHYSHYVIPAGAAANLSFYATVTSPQSPRQYFGHLEAKAPRYLALIFDCSDLDFAINDMPYVWDDAARGTLPLGWALPAALADAAPPVLHRYYAAAYRSGLDQFVLGPNGAGQLDLAAAQSPYAFSEATKRAQGRLDAHTVLYQSFSGSIDTPSGLPQFIADTEVRGVFAVGVPDFEPTFVSGAPVLATPCFTAVKDAVYYLDRVPLERRFVALCLDPRYLTPSDAAHIAAYVGSRYVVVAPEDMIELARDLSAPPQAGDAEIAITSVQYPESPVPDAPMPVRAQIEGPGGVLSAEVVFRSQYSPLAFQQRMAAGDVYQAVLPPLLCGGELTLSVRVVDEAGRVGWSPAWTMQVPRADADRDGLSDAEERFLLTDPSLGDSDGDGLLDGNDLYPLDYDQVTQTYFGPIEPPSDRPYLIAEPHATTPAPETEGATTEETGRWLLPGESCTYWLPLPHLPAAAPAVVRLIANGPASIATSSPAPSKGGLVLGEAGKSAYTDQFTGDVEGVWTSAPFTGESYPGGLLLRITCPAAASRNLVIQSLTVVSPPNAPSMTDGAVSPAHPGPDQPLSISALAFSPKGLKEVAVSYRVNDGGVISFPMAESGTTQRYLARLPALENRDALEWWVTATDAEGGRASLPISLLPVGSRSREVVSLVTTRDFSGDWTPAWNSLGPVRVGYADGVQDTAPVNLTGGNYAVWVFGGGRGKSIAVYVRGTRVGSINPDLPDGWQMVGKVRLDSGRHRVYLVSEARPSADPWAAPCYAAVLLSADPAFRPPAAQLIDIYNSLVLLSPGPDQPLSGLVELKATGAGNLTAAEFSLDGNLLRRASGPPFILSLNTGRYANGAHTLKVEGLDRAGPTGLVLEVPVTISN